MSDRNIFVGPKLSIRRNIYLITMLFFADGKKQCQICPTIIDNDCDDIDNCKAKWSTQKSAKNFEKS